MLDAMELPPMMTINKKPDSLLMRNTVVDANSHLPAEIMGERQSVPREFW